MKSKQIKWLVWTTAIMTLLVMVAVMATTVFVPRYLESKLIPELAQKYGLDARQAKIGRIGLFGTDLGPVNLDGDSTPVVRIAAVHIGYSPLSLIRGKINTIALNGVRVVMVATPKGVSIPGLKLPLKTQTDKKQGTFPDLDSLVPIGVEHFSLHQSEVVLLWKGRQLSIFVNLTLACGALNKGILKGNADLSIRGNTIALTAHLDQRSNNATFTMEGNNLLLSALAEMTDLPPHLSVSATAALMGQTRFQLAPLKLKALSVAGHLMDANLATSQAAIHNLTTPQGALEPIAFALEAPNPPTINWRCGPFLIDAPVNTHVLDLKGEWTPTQPGWSFNAVMETLFPEQTTDAGMALAKGLPMTWHAQARQEKPGAIEFDAHTTAPHPLALEITPFKISCPTYQLNIKGHLADHALSADGTLNASHIRLGLPDGEVEVAEVKVSSTFLAHPPAALLPSEIKTNVVLSKIRSKRETAQLIAPRIEIAATGQRLSAQPWHYRANLKMAKVSISDTFHGIRLSDIHLEVPLQWPLESSGTPGTLKVRAIQWKHHHLGDLRGRLQQKNKVMEIALHHSSRLFPKLYVLINGSVDTNGGTLKLNLPAYRFPKDVDIGRFLPDAAGILASGEITANAIISSNNGDLNGTADMKISQGSVHDEQRQLGLEGLHSHIVLDDLMALKSRPQQKLGVDHLSYGRIVADDLEMNFQLEDRQTIFIEKTSVQWCRGRINTKAIRIAPAKEAYDVTLFCDRLNLAMVLEQLGAGQASGEGTVSGKIPLRWQKGQLTFDKGFLYSTQAGDIKMTGTEVLLAGLPPETPQYTQVDIATEALKDYSYKWAKLNVDSQDENLVLKLQFDGKPNRLLPFAFDPQLGQLKRVAGQGQADFKGIGIDLNFRSPLNEILQYKELLTPNQ